MSTLNDEILREALAHLASWHGDRRGIHRTLRISESEHADLIERIKVVADAMRLRPSLRREDGCTRIGLDPLDGDQISTAQVALAARIEAAYQHVSGAPVTTLPVRPVARPWMRWRRGPQQRTAPEAT
ncbi:MAG: 4a-hydroxytetrahydrobiopterin dehydratase [Actinocatenispora sp.]